MKRIAVVVAVLSAVVACSGDNGGDLGAFCELVAEGAGDLTGSVDTDGLDALVEVAPPDIRSTMEQLRNLARDFNDIDPTELDQLFAAAFDVDALLARQRFDNYASEACDVDNATEGGIPTPTPEEDPGGLGADELVIDLRKFVEDNFSDDSWIDKVTFEIAVRTSDDPWAVRLTFVEPAGDSEAADACRRVSVWMYDVKRHDGSIEVFDSGSVEAARAGLEGSCTERDAADPVD